MMILTWLGSGFAFAIGVCIGVWIMRGLTKDRSASEVHETNAKSIAALTERNAIGREHSHQFERIADALTDMLEKQDAT